MESIEIAVKMLAIDTGYWPNKEKVDATNTVEVWNLSVSAAGITATDGSYPDWKGPYYKGIPKDPWGNNYFFDVDYKIGGSDYIVIGSFGPNGAGPNQYDGDDVIIILDGPT